MKNFVLIFITLLIGCGDLKYIESDKILEERIKEVVLSGNKQIDFNEIFPFGWDSLIILIPYSSPSIIGQNLKVDFRPVYGP